MRIGKNVRAYVLGMWRQEARGPKQGHVGTPTLTYIHTRTLTQLMVYTVSKCNL